MMHRETIQFKNAPANICIRAAGSHSGQDIATGPTEQERRAAREQQIMKSNDDVQNTLESLHFAVNEFEERRQQSISELQQLAVELAVVAASHVVRCELERESLGIEEFVADTIARMAVLEHATIRLHPDDLRSLQERLRGKTTPWNEQLIKLVADPAIDRGGVRLESESGRVVLSDVVTRLAQIRDEWMENINDTEIEQRRVSGDSGPMRRFPDRRETA